MSSEKVMPRQHKDETCEINHPSVWSTMVLPNGPISGALMFWPPGSMTVVGVNSSDDGDGVELVFVERAKGVAPGIAAEEEEVGV